MSALRKRLYLLKLSLLTAVPVAYAYSYCIIANAADLGSQAAGAAVTAKIERAGLSIWEKFKIIGKTAVIISAAFCGLMMVIGTAQMKEKIKENLYYIVAGLGLIYFASDFAGELDSILG